MFEKLKKIFKKTVDDNSVASPQPTLKEKKELKREDNYERPQTKIEPEPIIKQVKRSLKYRK